MSPQILFALLLLLSYCTQAPEKGIKISMSGMYKIENLDSLNHAASIVVIRIENQSNRTIFLPCDRSKKVTIYTPNYIYEDDPDPKQAFTTIIDCYSCNKIIALKPLDTLSVYSDLGMMGDCADFQHKKFVFSYPYLRDTTDKMINFFKIPAVFQQCNVSAQSKVYPY